MEQAALIAKADGSREPFDVSKLERSLRRAGASDAIVRSIAADIESSIEDGVTTQEIYRRAFGLLKRREEKPVAAKYSLKRAVFGMGPSGFPFEKFVAEIYRAKGYDVSVGKMIHGTCAEHEIDLLARAPEKTFAAEIKFHNSLGVKTDLKVALYVHARFNDLLSGAHGPGSALDIRKGILITNTKFTEKAIAYCVCSKVHIIGWDYPADENLYTLIGETGLHPVTCLTTLPQGIKRALLDRGVVLCRALKMQPDILRTLGVPPAKAAAVIEEINALCRPGAGV